MSQIFSPGAKSGVKIRILEENQSTPVPLLSACPRYLTSSFSPSSPRRSITLPPFPACHLPPPDILSANGLHCFPRPSVTLCQRYLNGAVKILRLSPCRRLRHVCVPVCSAALFTHLRNRSACPCASV